MSSIGPTLLISFIIIVLAICLLSIGFLIKGKPGFQLGRCGRDPTKKKDLESGCNTEGPCSVCGKPEEKVKKRKDQEEQE